MNHVQLFNRSALAIGLWLVLPSVILHAAPLVGTVFVHTDYLGSGVALSDSRGGIVQRVHYLPFGEATVVGGRNEAYELSRFTGKALDPATGLYYFGARYLDPRTGRFLSPDPARQTSAPHIYAGDAPLVNVDPDGRVFTDFEEVLARAMVSGEVVYFSNEHNIRVPTFQDIVDTRKNAMRKEGVETFDAAATRKVYESLKTDYIGLRDAYRAELNDAVSHYEKASERWLVSSKSEKRFDEDLAALKKKRKPWKSKKHKQIEYDLSKKAANWNQLATGAEEEKALYSTKLKELGPKVDACTKFINHCTKELNTTVVDPMTGQVSFR